MSRPVRGDRNSGKGRPKRRAAKTHFFKYQLAGNPSRAEENAIKRALQESLEEQKGKKGSNNISIGSTNSSDVNRSNISSSSNESLGSIASAASSKRTRSSISSINTTPVNNKRAKLGLTNGHQNNRCDANTSIEGGQLIAIKPTISHGTNRAIKTYSRSQPNIEPLPAETIARTESSTSQNKLVLSPPSLVHDKNNVSRSKANNHSSVSKSTQTQIISIGKFSNASDPSCPQKTTNGDSTPTNIVIANNKGNETLEDKQMPVQDLNLKCKRESKNYAYVKMTALKVSTQKSPSCNSRSSSTKKASPNGVLHNTSANKSSLEIATKKNIGSLIVLNHTSTTKEVEKPRDNSTKSSPMLDNKCRTPGSSSSEKSPRGADQAIFDKNADNKISKKAKGVQVVQLGGVKSCISKLDIDVHAGSQSLINDCSLDDTSDLSKNINQNQAHVKVTKKRLPQGSWSLLGAPEERIIYLRDDEPPRRLICYPAIKHVEGDVIQVRDSVLLRSGARKTDLPYIAKVCSFWEDAETGSVMMSLYWYYRPEHTEDGRKPHQLQDEVFASRHRDVDSVECIEDKCYVLTFNEYCRYRKRCKMEQVNTTWSLTDVTVPVSNESYPRRNRIPDSSVNPELVFCCRQIYDSRMKRLVKNPLINPKYGHI